MLLDKRISPNWKSVYRFWLSSFVILGRKPFLNFKWLFLFLCTLYDRDVTKSIYKSCDKRRNVHKTTTKKSKNVFCFCFCVVLCVCFCTGHFVMVPLHLTCLHCLQHSFFKYLFNLYYKYNRVILYTSFIYLKYTHLKHNALTICTYTFSLSLL